MSNESNTKLELNIDLSRVDFTNIALFAVGAAGAVAAFWVLHSVTAVFAALLPYVLGSTLFAAIVGTFFYLAKMMRQMRVQASMKFSFWELYTALAVFATMGFFAAACMQVFMGMGGNSLALWTNGAIACASFACFFGVGRFVGGLWNETAKS